jgi:magnesium transporter
MTAIIQENIALFVGVENRTVSNWISLVAPSQEELRNIADRYNIFPDSLIDVLDIDEQARVEREDSYLLIILRVPVNRPDQEIPYCTAPLGVVFAGDTVITVSLLENEVIRDLAQNRVRNFALTTRSSFLLHLFMRSATYYLRYLKEINRKTSQIEKDLQRSVKNNELIQLLSIEKSLVFFTTSLKSNELLMEKIQKPAFLRFNEDELDLLEDCLTENKQAIEMANIYSNILSGMMDAFASVISNNLNVVMKRLTVINLILMVPTLTASVYGMNVSLPFQSSPIAFFGIVGGSVGLTLLGTLFLRRAKFY